MSLYILPTVQMTLIPGNPVATVPKYFDTDLKGKVFVACYLNASTVLINTDQNPPLEAEPDVLVISDLDASVMPTPGPAPAPSSSGGSMQVATPVATPPDHLSSLTSVSADTTYRQALKQIAASRGFNQGLIVLDRGDGLAI